MATSLFERFLSMFGDKLPIPKGEKVYPVFTKHPSGLTGVERYLARMAPAEQHKEKEPRGATSVDRYLARKAMAEQQAPAPSSAESVAAYQTTQGEQRRPAQPDATGTRVAKYLAEHASKAAAAEKPGTATGSLPGTPKGAPPEADTATRCQAATAKGTQCTRTVNLTQVNRTIDGKEYQFTVCSQHASGNFNPYPAVIEKVH
jgi:hypothetical protein